MFETDRFYDWIESTTGWEIFGKIFGVNFGRPSLWRLLAMAALHYNGPSDYNRMIRVRHRALAQLVSAALPINSHSLGEPSSCKERPRL